ncbi:hypothetical protein Ciccas_006003 [Cichlidogyrus casuarinus]|uniref:Ion transport domain-containing protein n=1 Tax=Cichlidogyrus casuarinus TaxID=1844966 RepID=A0ABD2Q721_9PLAT
MIASVMCFCLGTHEQFREPVAKGHGNKSSLFCEIEKEKRDLSPKFSKDCFTEPAPALVGVDAALNVLFTLEFLLKLLLAPYKQKFLKSIVSILDMIILSSYWAHIALFYIFYYGVETFHQERLWFMNIFSLTQSLRIFRVFKISKISRGLRVLILTVKKSIPELVLLAFLLMNGMFMFSSLIYMAEYGRNDTFPDIPRAFWWSIITLTTVGFGDMVPKSPGGYLVGSLTAISGCILTGLAIPIIGNNFNTYYKYMKNQLKEDKYLKELSRDRQSPNANLKQGIGYMAIGRKYRLIKASVSANGDAKGPKNLKELHKNPVKISVQENPAPKVLSRRSSQNFELPTERKASILMPLSLDDQNFPLAKVPIDVTDDEEDPEEIKTSPELAPTRKFSALHEEESNFSNVSDQEEMGMPSDIEEAARAAREILANGPISLKEPDKELPKEKRENYI